jgi:Ser/Thr protein kinase RdoA (MazF antagonist)
MTDYESIIRYAWRAYDHTRTIGTIDNISAKVSTNSVFQLNMEDGNTLIAKVTVFGSFEGFAEDHTIVNVLANNLPVRYANFLSRALMKGNQLFFHRYIDTETDAWVVFYRPIHIQEQSPKRLNLDQIAKLGSEIATFHRDCTLVSGTLPRSNRDMTTDVDSLLRELPERYPDHQELIHRHCHLFLENTFRLNTLGFEKIPVFIDWNIGNFSIHKNGSLASRWDYDWFRMSTRVSDFYFLSRVVSEVGDQDEFTYEVERMMEDRFLHFLKAYHKVFPLSATEVRFTKEAYRFFLLNYVLRLGSYFFRPEIATKLTADVLNVHLPTLDEKFDPEVLVAGLELE